MVKVHIFPLINNTRSIYLLNLIPPKLHSALYLLLTHEITQNWYFKNLFTLSWARKWKNWVLKFTSLSLMNSLRKLFYLSLSLPKIALHGNSKHYIKDQSNFSNYYQKYLCNKTLSSRTIFKFLSCIYCFTVLLQ